MSWHREPPAGIDPEATGTHQPAQRIVDGATVVARGGRSARRPSGDVSAWPVEAYGTAGGRSTGCRAARSVVHEAAGVSRSRRARAVPLFARDGEPDPGGISSRPRSCGALLDGPLR
ncbi:hypothetical protein [Streptomyces sp. NPDC059176]|uniref:hypothetical protein n=1 Tax=unclassified Streptomyces TaxID=2593676 RepID=UPI00368D282B